MADVVWERFGRVPNYVEPFAGSLAVLLARPHDPGTETVNDADAFLSNFWRSVAWAPEETARWADWPVSEPDLLARHRWLVNVGARRLQLLREDPEFYDASRLRAGAGLSIASRRLYVGRSSHMSEPIMEALRRLVSAAEDYVSSDPDMPSHAEAEETFEDAMANAKAVLGEDR